MLRFEVPDMSCDHCVKAITQAVKTADPTAAVQTDLTRHQVQVSDGKASAETLLAAIADAGYTPRLM